MFARSLGYFLLGFYLGMITFLVELATGVASKGLGVAANPLSYRLIEYVVLTAAMIPFVERRTDPTQRRRRWDLVAVVAGGIFGSLPGMAGALGGFAPGTSLIEIVVATVMIIGAGCAFVYVRHANPPLPHECQSCGYDLRSQEVAGDACPECGALSGPPGQPE